MCDGGPIPTSTSDRIVDELNPERNLARSDIESLIEPPVGASVTRMHIRALMYVHSLADYFDVGAL